MPSPTTMRGLLGQFPRGAYPPANDRRATTPPVRLPTSLSLRVISTAGAGGRGVWAGASGRRSTSEVGRGGAGKEESKGWRGESKSSDEISDAESEKGEEEPALLTASPWGTQESGACGLRVGARAGGSGGEKATSGTADGGEIWSRHGAQKHHRGGKGGRQERAIDDPWGVGGNSGGRKASGVGPNPHGVEWEEGVCEASEVEKTPRRVRHGVEGGGRVVPGRLEPPRRGRESSRDDLTPTGGGC